MREPKVLIYMSCYNHEKYVREAMDSIVGQTYRNWELFVANDGSTDRTGEILASYQDDRIHFYNFEENTKFVGASNFLQDSMRDVDADYIATMSSDDKWKPEKLERQIEILNKHPEYRACFTWDEIIFDYEDAVYRQLEDYSHKRNRSRYDWMRRFFLYGNCLNACSMLMSKSVFYELGGMNQSFFSLADFRLWMQFVNRYSFYLCGEPLTYYRRHENNISKSSSANFVRSTYERYKISKDVIEQMNETTFVRTFYRKLVYRRYGSKEAYAAEKFMLLIDETSLSGEQAAIDLYLSFSENAEFLRILQQDYGYMPHDFTELTGNAGIAFISNMIYEAKVLEQKELKRFSPWEIFLGQLDAGRVDAERLAVFSYNVLTGLYQYTCRYEGGERQFLSIRDHISRLRRERIGSGGRRVLYLIGEDSEWDVRGHLAEPGDDKLFICYVPKTETMFAEETEKGNICRQPIADVSYLELYDGKEHRLRFAEETGERIDRIIYVDCITPEYDCRDMAEGYSLAVEQACILRGDIYERVKREDAAALAVMERVQIYTQKEETK